MVIGGRVSGLNNKISSHSKEMKTGHGKPPQQSTGGGPSLLPLNVHVYSHKQLAMYFQTWFSHQNMSSF